MSTLIHISFDNWTAPATRRPLQGSVNEAGEPEDYLLGLPILLGNHSRANIASIVSSTLQDFKVDGERLGYFVLDNTTNNDAAVEVMADEYKFFAPYRRPRSNDVNWLRDFLPLDIPNARIFSWGYNANTHSTSEISVQYLYDHATNLIDCAKR